MTAVHYAILTHNRPESLATLLQSIEAQTHRFKRSTTVLDNGSSQRQAAAIRNLADRFRVTLLRSNTNLRMAGRRALEDRICDDHPDGDVLVHLDDDVVLHDGWLTATLHCLDRTGFAACGSVEDHDGDPMISGQRTIDIQPHATAGGPVNVWRMSWHVPKPGEDIVPVEFAGHRALAVRMDAACAVRHDPRLVAGGDDIAYSLALRRRGHKLAVSTCATIRHRSLREPDLPGFRTPSMVIDSWRTFHQTWGFVRGTAATEAQMTLDDFLHAITDHRLADMRGTGSLPGTEASA